MKKIHAEKNEGIAEIIDKILAVEDPDVLLVIPKGSALAKSASNFRLLKREADSAEKTLTVESLDEEVQSLAEENGIKIAIAHAAAKHSRTADGVGVSDIVAKSDARDDEDADDESDEVSQKGKSVKLPVRGESESFFGDNRFFKPRAMPEGNARDDEDDGDDEGKSRGGGKAIAWILGIIVFLAVAFYAVTVLFGRAQVTIDFTQTPWSYQGDFTADQSVSAIDPTTNTIPAQIFTAQKNITQLFPATGQSGSVSVKAQGTIIIYNDYSSAPQELVATTRFLTPNGQIFRLVNDVTVPGAQVAAGGAITPSSITAPIIADQGGPAYNVGPVAKLTIPGFQNVPAKEAGFYGSIASGTSGGFTGARAIPTAADIASAKASTTAILQSDLEGGLATSYPNNFKILDGATDIVISKLIVNTSTDANGDFTIFGEASLTAIGFDQSALASYLLGLATGGQSSSTFKPSPPNLSYSDVQADFSKGQVSFALSGQGAIEPAFSPSDFASSIAGESIGAARDAIQALPQLSDGQISVWPVWLWNIPSDPNKIQVTAN